jgi:hypothetical protein
MVTIRLEMEESVMNESQATVDNLNYILGSIFPGLTALPPRKEGDACIMEISVPDDMVEDADHVWVCSIKKKPSSEYDYDVERKFKLI